MNRSVKIALVTLLGAAQIAFMTLPAYAAVSSTTLGEKKEVRQSANEAARITRIHESADKEIDRRTASLTELSSRISEMKHESDASKAALASTISAQLAQLAALKTKIAGDTDLETLKTDTQSITKAYRIYMLVMPSTRIVAASDRINDIAGEMGAIGTKLSTRITEAGSAGNDVTKLTVALTDMNAKLADAKTQADGAVSGIAGLTPDNGDKTKMDSNTAALKAARAKIKAGEADLKAARADIKTIIAGLKAIKKVATSTPPTAN